jgi:hypothetical protein
VVDLLGKKCRKLALGTEAEHRILAAMIIMADSKKLLVQTFMLKTIQNGNHFVSI